MDINTLIAGYRPLAEDEKANKLASLRRGYELVKSNLLVDSLDEFLARQPGELLSHYFGSPALDAYLTEHLSAANFINPIEDVFYSAILNELVMLLTFQGRSLRRALPPECAVFVGANQNQLFQAMLNGNSVFGASVADYAYSHDLRNQYVSLFDKNENVIKHTIGLDRSNIADWLKSQAFNVGVLALVDNAQVQDFNSILENCSSKIYGGTFLVLKGEVDQMVACLANIKANYPEIEVISRFYRYVTNNVTKQKMVLVCKGFASAFKVDFVEKNPTPITFINVQHMVNIGDERFKIEKYGEKFIAEGIAEHVEVKAPIILKSSAPLPEYTRDILEQMHPVAHVVARVKGGGVYYSRDHRHSTNIFVTNQNEVIEDFMEHGSFHASPVYENSVLNGTTRTGELEPRAKSYHEGTFIPLCFAPTVHHFHSHFLLQCFPRVLIAREKNPDAKFFVPWDLRKYQREMMNVVGVRDDQMVPMYPDTTYFADELIIPRLWPAIFTKYSEQIYSEMVASVGEPVEKPHRRILISREARTTWRNMVNYNLVKDILVNEFGFEVVSPDKLSLFDEITLFKEAQIIAGAEGAGLYNCCFASPNSAVLSIADQDYAMYIIGSMAAIRGFEVAYVFGESFLAESDLALRGAGHSDFIVSPDAVRKATKQLIYHLENK